jgi:hypothetical protein
MNKECSMMKLFWQYRGPSREYPTDEQGMFNGEVILAMPWPAS